MIEKLVSEVEWIDALAGLPAFMPPSGPVLFVAPHPDDESLAGGGLLRSLIESGISVTVVAVTDGEAAYTPRGDLDLARRRRGEQISALSILGVPEAQTCRFSLPDRFVSEYESTLAAKLITLLEAAGPETTLIAPWSRDFHSDHEAAGRASELAAAHAGCRLVRWLWWSWHHRTIRDVTALPLRKFCLEPRWLDRKLSALAEHRSQLGAEAILPEDLLQPAYRDFEVFA